MTNHKLLALAMAGLLSMCVGAASQAQTLSDLLNDEKETSNVLTYGMGYSNQRYSPLKSINKSNVARLVPVWNYSLNNSQAQESQPIVKDGVMYVTTHSSTVAIDALSGKQIWKQELEFPSDLAKYHCCGQINRGAAIFNGMLYRTTLDAHVIAYDTKTGKQIWRSKAADYREGQGLTAAPLLANGVLMTGISGGEYGTRGFIDGWDPQTGKKLWRFYTTAAPGEKGGDTWPGDTHLRGGAPTWLTGVYDPELDLVYWGTGNGGPWNAEARKGDNLHINSVLAFRPKTGELVWHYQFSPNDPFDYDSTEVGMLIDLDVGGVKRKVLAQANRNGFFYVLDRTNGKLLAANPYTTVNWADKIDLASGRPVESAITQRVRAGADEVIFPSAIGGKNWTPVSWNPATKLVYANTLDFGFPYQLAKPEYKKGEWYTGINFRGFTFPKDRPHGHLQAIDPMTGKAKWQMAWPGLPSMAGTLSTAGGLVFTGAATGEVIAVDAETGKKLWQFQTGSGIIGLPVTWERNGVQYVSIVSGGVGVYSLTGDERLSQVPAGGSVWTFAIR